MEDLSMLTSLGMMTTTTAEIDDSSGGHVIRFHVDSEAPYQHMEKRASEVYNKVNCDTDEFNFPAIVVSSNEVKDELATFLGDFMTKEQLLSYLNAWEKVLSSQVQQI